MKAVVFAVVCFLSVGLAFAMTPKINLNQASVLQLTQSFKGIGKRRAEAIVAYRASHGGFKSVADLAYVRGLGGSFVKNHLAQLQDVYSIN